MKSRICLILTLFVIAITINNINCDYTQGHNGRPHCLTDEEIIQVKWRNNFDPTRYWICSEQGVAGTRARCQDATLFSGETNKCVPAAEWVWTPLVDPPSLA